jgi:hypothetical protein
MHQPIQAGEPTPGRALALRGLVIDAFPYTATDQEIARAHVALGLTPSSPEGVNIERELSNARMRSVQPLEDLLAELCVYSAEAVTQYMLGHVTDPDADIDTIRQVMITQNAQVIGIAAHCVIAHLMERGALELKKE